LPSDVGRRTDTDFARLASYARHLNADVVALEEIDGPQVAARVFPPERYQLILTPDAIVQRTGIAVRRGIGVTVNAELSALNTYGNDAPHPLRGGLDVTLTEGRARLRVLVVHLKTGCWDQPLSQRAHSCPTLLQQFRIIDDWALERQDEGEAFAILGDFNRRLTEHDPMMAMLDADAPMMLTTAGYASPCWGGEYFIDHILLGNAARTWLEPSSLRVMTYRESPDIRSALSDHCPVSVRLDLPV
jgi:endonuclease/exonuclease/phosphatase family metal-dependent hydrolase